VPYPDGRPSPRSRRKPTGKFVGLANNTKWNELISAIRAWKEWRPSYRTKGINGFISRWDVEWLYHLPFPFKYVLWFDIGCHQAKGTKIIDRTEDLVRLVSGIGLDYEVRGDTAASDGGWNGLLDWLLRLL